jgi:FtsP/CotA-like multicopper oxidase with cupredoxin domain
MLRNFSRRSFLFGVGAAGVMAVMPNRTVLANADRAVSITAKQAMADLLRGQGPKTSVWAYDGLIPGPEIRIRQNDLLNVAFKNELPQPSTVHWHGVRLPNAMDGVPNLTQKPVGPGQSFDYAFRPPDAGTYWYHPHVKSSEQVGRGLHGALIIEEREPPKVDRDITWVLDDWRLTEDGAVHDSFSNMHDMSHGGRIGNIATLNGEDSHTFRGRAGERLRLRLINVANARGFALTFSGHSPVVIALDGQPVAPYSPPGGRVKLGSGQRVDLIIDLNGQPGDIYKVIDTYFDRQPYKFLDLVYSDEKPLRESPLNAPVQLPPNPLSQIDIANAKPMEIRVSGGAMGRMRNARFRGKTRGIRDLVQMGKAWAINDQVFDPENMEPLFTLEKGNTYRLLISNDTAWSHPIHLHGHVFKITMRNGVVSEREIWTDTVLLEPDEQVEVVMVVDNPGDWLLHCHILEHHEAGMGTVIRVV